MVCLRTSYKKPVWLELLEQGVVVGSGWRGAKAMMGKRDQSRRTLKPL